MGPKFWVVTLAVAMLALGAPAQTLPADSGTGPQTAEMLLKRVNSGQADQVIALLEPLLNYPAQTAAAGVDSLYVLSRASLKSDHRSAPESARIIDRFIQSAPNDPRGGELLFRLGAVERDPAQRVAIYQRAVQLFPLTEWALHSRGAIRRIENIGKPFQLDFTDAINEKPVSVQSDFKGKVVVILFWAGWCSDCAAEMPRIKALYEGYHAKGVEFVGVSLDRPEAEGGLRTLKSAVEKFKLPWPQYFQGNYFESEFSGSLGINAIPCAFIVDRQGNLRSDDALPQLEKLIPQLLGGT